MERIVSEVAPISISFIEKSDIDLAGREIDYDDIRWCRVTWSINYVINKGSLWMLLDIERVDISFITDDPDLEFINGEAGRCSFRAIIEPCEGTDNFYKGRMDIYPIEINVFKNHLIEVTFNG